MNILLTGGTGYIGSHTALVLSELGHKAVLLDNLSNSSEIILEKLKQITGSTFSFVKGDIRDTGLIKQTLNDFDIEIVFHFAGLKSVGESVIDPMDYYSNNVLGTISLIDAMRAQSIKSLVFSSSATVYGAPQYLPIDELHPTSATNPYGRTKLHIEEMLHDLVSSDEEWAIVSLRYFNPVGAHESGLIGEMPKGIPNNLMPYIAEVAIGKSNELQVFGDDYATRDGTGVRDYVHVMDVAQGHAAALDFLKTNGGFHPINLGTGQGLSVLEIVHSFEKACSKKIPYRVISRRPGDIDSCYANVQKAAFQLNWKAERTLKEMCESAWKFQQSAVLKKS
jgi:UDP-glucose 4-epimerase